jgi:hypothetical protein
VKWLLVLAITLVTARAEAHVSASVDDNNRYLKLTPAGDHVRLAYTVFYGEKPGAATRPQIDTNHDGEISEAEGAAFGGKLAAEVRGAVTVSVDGIARQLTWARVAVGMGTPTTSGGSFSIDLIAYLCLDTPRGSHAFTLRDDVRLPRPGETEVLVEAPTGITIQAAHVGSLVDPGHDFKFAGHVPTLAAPGLAVSFTADATAAVGDVKCAVANQGLATTVLVAIAFGIALAAYVGFAFLRRRRK